MTIVPILTSSLVHLRLENVLFELGSERVIVRNGNTNTKNHK